jgi:hypothetical protein
MQLSLCSGVDGALLVRVIANRDDVVELLPVKLAYRLRPLGADVDTALFHGFHRERVDHAGRMRPSTEHLNVRLAEMAEQSLSNLAACRISRTQDKDSRHSEIFEILSKIDLFFDNCKTLLFFKPLLPPVTDASRTNSDA